MLAEIKRNSEIPTFCFGRNTITLTEPKPSRYRNRAETKTETETAVSGEHYLDHNRETINIQNTICRNFRVRLKSFKLGQNTSLCTKLLCPTLSVNNDVAFG